MSGRFIGAAVVGVCLGQGLVVAQAPGAPDTALAARAADRLQALHAEADRLAAEERTLLGDLRKLEVEREIRTTELARARAASIVAADEVARIDRQSAALDAEVAAARPDLNARLVTLYKLGRGRYARLLLSASDLRQFGQATRLVSALAERDRQRVAAQQRRVAELAEARRTAQERRAQLAQLQQQAEQARAQADTALAARRALVQDIDARRDLTAQYAAELLAAQEKLQGTLPSLGAGAPALPIAPFKGDLAWPAPGSLRNGFGTAAPGRPPLRGIEIATAAGSDVRAVHEGTVVFADAFSGYGRLVIVDHGNQTFTLYGNLADIAVARGKRIERGETLGTAGVDDSARGVLYFELRVDGRAVDPVQWLSKR